MVETQRTALHSDGLLPVIRSEVRLIVAIFANFILLCLSELTHSL